MEWWQRQQATAEAARRRALMETYTTPLPKNNESDKLALRTFLSNFYKTFYNQSSHMERKAILEEYNEVKVYHDKLVVANQTKDIRAHPLIRVAVITIFMYHQKNFGKGITSDALLMKLYWNIIVHRLNRFGQ